MRSMSAGETTAMAAETRVAELEAAVAAARGELAVARDRLAAVTKARDRLRTSHERLRLELEMLKRRIFVAKAERVDTAQLEIEFADKLRQLDALAGRVPGEGADGESGVDAPSDQGPSGGGAGKGKRNKPTGRRDFTKLPLEEERIEIADPLYEQLVADGKAERIGFEESCKVGWKRGGMRRVVLARAKYQVVTAGGTTAVDTTPMPPQAFPRSLAAPSLFAHILMEKYGKGLPLFRIEESFARDGVPIDRGTMSRWVEDAGATAGATVIEAAREEAMRTAFCIATDATGVPVQPIRTHERVRQACKRGHYFVHIADRDHVFFEYTARETGPVVAAMFKGYSGYIQADAKSVYDVLFRDPAERPPDDDDGATRYEVGCWSHGRRKWWEAAVAKDAVAREGLARIGRVFALEETWRGKPPALIKQLRNAHLRPHMEAFFAWAEALYETVRDQRGLLRTAVGYSVRQRSALLRVLDDGRLLLDNNRSERELRRVATGRKAWLFVGSDDHAEAAGHVLSLIASAKLHSLDPEAYLRDFYRVLPHWPRERYLELAPKYWAATRSRLDAAELAREVGPLSVPDAMPAPPEQQATPHIAG